MKTVLVVIDMQKDFTASSNKIAVKEIKRQIGLAKKREGPIVFVEYKDFGETNPELMNLALTEYDEVYQFEKYDDDGSKEIVEGLSEFGISHKKLRVCGINTDCCVLDTVVGLSERYPNTHIEVIKKGCATEYGGSGWRRWRNHTKKSIILVK